VAQERTHLDVPYAHGIVEAARGDEVRLRIEVDTEYKALVAAQGLDALAVRKVPDLDVLLMYQGRTPI